MAKSVQKTSQDRFRVSKAKLQFIDSLSKLVTQHQLDFLEVDGVKIGKTRHYAQFVPPPENKPQTQANPSLPNDQFDWGLDAAARDQDGIL